LQKSHSGGGAGERGRLGIPNNKWQLNIVMVKATFSHRRGHVPALFTDPPYKDK
jgi:hypothetical protein